MNAQEFADSLEFPIVFFAGVGSPAGTHIAILETTDLPFDLSEIDGAVSHGVFEAEDIDGCDWNGNTIQKLQLFSSEDIWRQQKDDYDADC